jgi:hypothetical protein
MTLATGVAVLALTAASGAASAATHKGSHKPSGGGTTSTPTWAPASSATIHPGVMTYTNGGQCTANFIYTDGAGNVYIGQAAHCSGTDGNTATDGCTSHSLPLGTPVEVDGASKPGTMVYNSWLAMQKANEKNADVCAYNDLALVKLDPADVANVNPSVPTMGGPSGLRTAGLELGDQVYTYGNSSLRLGVTLLSPKTGYSVGDDGNGWSHGVYTVTPGIPGDSGSGLMDDTGLATGVLSTVEIAPLPASNNFGDLAKELAYAASHGLSVSLAPGTEPFTGNLF